MIPKKFFFDNLPKPLYNDSSKLNFGRVISKLKYWIEISGAQPSKPKKMCSPGRALVGVWGQSPHGLKTDLSFWKEGEMLRFLKKIVALPVLAMLLGAALPLDRTEFTTGEIMVNGVIIVAPRPSVSGVDGVIMLPLRAIGEALHFALEWDEAERRIDITDRYSLWIGRTEIARDNVISDFGPAPVLIDDSTFVPISFFNFGIENVSAEIIDGVVVIVSLQ